ncbi:MAG TPA: penicillin-binding protein 2 [Actinomycetota bacterium]
MTRRGPRPALRLIWLLASVTLVMLLMGGRLVQLQVVQAAPLEELGEQQRVRELDLPALRGSILDRSRKPLALSADARAVVAYPSYLGGTTASPAVMAALIAPLLEMDAGEIETLLGGDENFVYLKRQVPPSVAQAVLDLRLPHVDALKETRRVYPSGSLAGQVVGFVNVDGDGLAGLEAGFDELLRGTAGVQVIERDPTGRPIPQGNSALREPVPGSDVVLTIDQRLQFKAEDALARGAIATKARYGTAVVLDVRNGDVLAMATWPPFDPNEYARSDPASWRNRPVLDTYEPGSVFKPIAASAAIAAGIAAPWTTLVVPDSIAVGGRIFRDYEPHRTERLSYSEALARSSNVGTIKVALRAGPERLVKMMRSFGVGAPTGVGFPGEASGLLPAAGQWSGTSIATIPIGQGVSLTPLQLASIYATIGNRGVRVAPRLVKGTVDPAGTFRAAPKPEAHRVLSRWTATQVLGMLVGVVQQGTGTRAQIPGYLVGGKTGTAAVPYVDRRGYSGDIITTFAGVGPADSPRLATVVQLYNPTPRYAALTAAPVWREIMQFALGTLGIEPTARLRDAVSLGERRAVPPLRPARVRKPKAEASRVAETP